MPDEWLHRQGEMQCSKMQRKQVAAVQPMFLRCCELAAVQGEPKSSE